MTPRLLQLLWLVGGAIFTLALVHSLSGGQTSDWVTNNLPMQGLTDSSRVSLKQHMKLAEKSWAKTVKQRHDLIALDWADSPKDIDFFPSTTVPNYFKKPYSIWDFVPASYSCPHEMERIGRMGDGGKWVCGFSKYEEIPKSKPCVIYSFGVQFESSYEDETLSRTNCEIWAYDFSVVDFGEQLRPENRGRAHFTQAGIAGKTDPSRSPPFHSIQDLMRMNGHDYIDILKMDIEFAEFESLTSLSHAFPESSGSFPIGQLLVEIHLFGRENLQGTNPEGLNSGKVHPITSGEFLDWWEMLESRGMRPAWTEPNLLYSTLKLEGGGDPRLAEYSFINVMDKRNVLFGGLTQAEVGR